MTKHFPHKEPNLTTAHLVPCPFCGAEPWHGCTDKNGNPLRFLHIERIKRG